MTDLKKHLQSRRTVPSANLSEPGPDGSALNSILTMAARTPDHGKLVPYRFIVIRGEKREKLSQICLDRHEELMTAQDRTLTDAEREKTRNIFLFAPVIVALINRSTNHGKIPVWEQNLTVGAVGMNLIHGSYAEGFMAQWLTGWVSTDEVVKSSLGVLEEESIAGFFHLGSPSVSPVERPRPDLAEITQYWDES